MQSWHSPRKTLPSLQKTNRSNGSTLASTCQQIVDVCLLGTLIIAPLFFGGRHPLGRFVFILLVSVAGVAWAVRQTLVSQSKWTRSWANALGFAALFLVALQLLPLPAQWLKQLAPRNNLLLTLWNSNTNSSLQLGEWQTLSLTPSSTKIALATLSAYFLLFITTICRLQEQTDIQRLIRSIAVAAILMSGFGVLQYFTSNGLFFWFYEYPFTNTSLAVKGSFTTPNHFAHFIALGIGPLLAWIVLLPHQNRQKRNGEQSSTNPSQIIFNYIALYIGLVVAVLAILLSFSRGGAVALAIASTFTIVIFYRKGLISGTYLYGLAMLGLLVIGMLSISGYEKVAHRLDDFTVGSIEGLDRHEGRRKIWQANIEATRNGSLFGAGAGSHPEIYPIYLQEFIPLEYTHAENGYLQIATENGFIGIALLTLAILIISSWCWRALRNATSKSELVLAGAITASLIASMVHSLVDFVWFIPSCMSVTILLAACALRLAQLTTSPNTTKQLSVVWSKPRWVSFTAVTACTAAWAITTTLGPAAASLHWDKYLLSSAANKKVVSRQLTTGQQQSENPNDQELYTEAMIFHLQKALSQDPLSHRAHLRLAGKYLQLFSLRQSVSDNAMSIDQIRDAVQASKFSSAKALQQWLLQAFGENSRLLYRAHYHVHQALKQCPLQGAGYLYLADLCFLEGHTSKIIDAYIEQGLQVRPYDGKVLFKAGRQRLLMGQVEQAFDHLQQSYRDTGTHQLKIIQLLAGQLPADTFLKLFKPDWRTLQPLWNRYQLTTNNVIDLEALLSHAEIEAKQASQDLPPKQATSIWFKLAYMQTQLKHHDLALASSQQAYQLDPSNYSVRRSFGQKLLKAQRYRQAEFHLRWCLTRRPDDAMLQKELIQATKSRLPDIAKKATRSQY